jgi:CRP-like cAMP-binding protein
MMPELKETAEFLSKVPLFKTLKHSQLESLAKVARPDDFAAGEDIVTQGEGGVGLFIIVSGQADVVHVRRDGTRRVVNRLGTADYFGELALLTEGPRTASVVATEPTQVLILARWDFMGLLKRDGEMAIAILQELAWRFSLALEVM